MIQPPNQNLPHDAQPKPEESPSGGGRPEPPARPNYPPPPSGDGPAGPYGASPPPKKSPLPFIIGGLVLLLVAGGVGLYFLLKDDASPTPVADVTASPTMEDPGPPGGEEPNFPESGDVASGFIQAMIDADYQAAYGMLAADGQAMFPDGQALADDFFLTIGASTVTGAETTSVTPTVGESDLDVRDLVTFDLDTDVGTVGFTVQVCEEAADLTICAYR